MTQASDQEVLNQVTLQLKGHLSYEITIQKRIQAVISATTDSPRMISFKNSDFAPAALVVPGKVL